MPKKPDPRLKRAGVSGYNKPKRTPGHPKKSHVVVAKEGGKVKTIRFGQQGVKGAGKKPSTTKEKARRKSFKARHAKNIAKGKMSAAYWADKVKWTIIPFGVMISIYSGDSDAKLQLKSYDYLPEVQQISTM